MAMKRCPICGENYSDTYKSCPFCEEEAALQRGNQLRRGGRGGKRASSGNKRGQPNLLSPILVILILIMAALLVYLLFGDKIADQLAGNQEDPGTEEVTPAPPTLDENEDEDTTAPEVGTDTDDQDDGEGTGDTAEETDLTALPETLTMSYLGAPKTEFTMSVGDDSIPLTASGGSGSYTWSSSDENIATVDADGKVSASLRRPGYHYGDGRQRQGHLHGAGEGRNQQRTDGPATPSSSAPKLSSTDFTTHVGDPDVQLKVSGTTPSVTWASKNTGIATVSGSGVVKAVSAGTTTITATVDGKVLECIVRVTK